MDSTLTCHIYAWVENLTEEYKNNISAYIVIDMIGDAYLDFTKVDTRALGYNNTDCCSTWNDGINLTAMAIMVSRYTILTQQEGLLTIMFLLTTPASLPLILLT